MNVTRHPLDWYVSRLRERQVFTFTRWGDGEWRAVLQLAGAGERNCDGHRYFPELCRRLRDVLASRPPYILAMQPLAMRLYADQITQYAASLGLPTEWHDADVFHRASRKQRLAPLWKVLRKRELVLVGPKHLLTLREQLRYNAFVEVPLRNCFTQLSALRTATETALRACRPGAVVAVAAGMPAEVLIHQLFAKYGTQHFLIDFGSLFDPYAGVRSRSYHKHIAPLP